MNPGISKTVIVLSFFFINFIQSSHSAESHKIHKSEDNQANLLRLTRTLKNKNSSNPLLNNGFQIITLDKKFLEENSSQLLVDLRAQQEELVIQSDKQSEVNNVLFAEGNVSVSYRGKQLKADKLIYDKLNKKISAEGNITLFFGKQIFKISKVEYNFKNETGYL